MSGQDIGRLTDISRSRTERATPRDRPLRVHLHAQARLLAESRRGLLLQFARSVLRHIRVASKYELKQRIIAGINDVNRHPVIHTWSYKLAEAA